MSTLCLGVFRKCRVFFRLTLTIWVISEMLMPRDFVADKIQREDPGDAKTRVIMGIEQTVNTYNNLYTNDAAHKTSLLTRFRERTLVTRRLNYTVEFDHAINTNSNLYANDAAHRSHQPLQSLILIPRSPTPIQTREEPKERIRAPEAVVFLQRTFSPRTSSKMALADVLY